MAARTETIDNIITRALEAADAENDQHLSSAEKFRMANVAIAETWDAIIDCGLGDKWVTYVDFNTTSGTLAYDLFGSPGANATDFYRVSKVYVNEGSGSFRPLVAINPGEVHSFRPPAATVPIRMYYVKYSPVLTTGQTFDGINGWEEHAVQGMAAAIKKKKDDDPRPFERRKGEIENRMRRMGLVDMSEPRRVSRKRRFMNDPWVYYNNNVNAYLIRGDKIELMYNYGNRVI